MIWKIESETCYCPVTVVKLAAGVQIIGMLARSYCTCLGKKMFEIIMVLGYWLNHWLLDESGQNHIFSPLHRMFKVLEDCMLQIVHLANYIGS